MKLGLCWHAHCTNPRSDIKAKREKEKPRERKREDMKKKKDARLLFLSGLACAQCCSNLQDEKKRSFVYKQAPPKSTSHKARSDQISAQICQIFQVDLNYRASNENERRRKKNKINKEMGEKIKKKHGFW